METTELLKKVRKIEIKTRGLSNHIFAGQYHSAFKGKGIAFSEVREYQYGDDIRSIDWNVTARFDHPYVKVFEEERELTVMLLVDLSGSGLFGTGNQLKRDRIVEMAAVIAFSAIQNNDKVGAVLFSGKAEKFIPPKKGRQHILRIIREIIEFMPQSSGTNISECLRYFTNIQKKKSIAFIISDFLDLDNQFNPSFEDALSIASRKHDVVALRIYDSRESELPNVGLLKLRDNETGQMVWIDSSRTLFREKYKKWWKEYDDKLKNLFLRTAVDSINVDTSEDYVKPLMNLFKRR